MPYDFDSEIPRRGTNCVKWEFMPGGEHRAHWQPTDRCFGDNRVLPMWVADMDFPCPTPVVEALMARAAHPIYGYTEKTAAYAEAVVTWMQHRHGWRIAPEWIVTTPGVVPALHLLVRTFSAPGERVLIQPPVYYPFFSAITNNHGTVLTNPLIYEHGRYHMDVADLEAKLSDPHVRMAIVCSPHNPVGRVWTKDELERLGQLCLHHNVLVVSDEIHGDVVYTGHTFTPFASLSEEFAQHAIICTAPSKTFNLAGLQTSNIIIPNAELRSRFEQTVHSTGLFGINVFGAVAVEAAYTHGEAWLEQLMGYLEENLHYLEDYVARELPHISVVRPEGTYLVWLDCRRLGLEPAALQQWLVEEARVDLEAGVIFGAEGAGFARINIACPRSILSEALKRIKAAVDQLPQRSG